MCETCNEEGRTFFLGGPLEEEGRTVFLCGPLEEEGRAVFLCGSLETGSGCGGNTGGRILDRVIAGCGRNGIVTG